MPSWLRRKAAIWGIRRSARTKSCLTRTNNRAGKTPKTEGSQPLSDSEMQALWLRRVQTKPADFLKAKFAYQLSAREQEGGEQ